MRRLLLLAVLGFGSGMAGAATTLSPGQWQMVNRVVSVDIPGTPPGMAEMMRKRPMAVNMCLTPEQAARDPRSLFESSNGRCKYTKFVMAAGRLAFDMTCKGGMGGGGNSIMSSTGRYTPTSYSVHSTMVSVGPRGTTRIVSDGVGKRVGDCKK